MMNQKLAAIQVERKSGSEHFHDAGSSLPFTVLDFWRWSSSDLLTNALRGIVAEFLVSKALSLPPSNRVEWNAYDLETESGIKIEVKSSAYLQSWQQKKPSVIKFDVRETLGWDSKTNVVSDEKHRHADVYVFCLLHHTDKLTVDPLDVSQWSFYVTTSDFLNQHIGSQASITLGRLKSLGVEAFTFSELADVIG